ncbi:MAG: hypothetical protein ACYS9C_12975 [Planctomycetota bacterium]|jgi:hypothetical protein
MKRFSRAFYIIIILVGVAAFVVMSIAPVYRDWAFICENTGSRKGDRAWFFGVKTGHWYKESRLEEFMKTNYPDDLSYRWVSYEGTGKNIFGTPVLYGHGRPELAHLPYEVFNRYLEHIDDKEKRRLYEIFSSADVQRIEDEVSRIWEKVLDMLQSETEPLDSRDSQ